MISAHQEVAQNVQSSWTQGVETKRTAGQRETDIDCGNPASEFGSPLTAADCERQPAALG